MKKLAYLSVFVLNSFGVCMADDVAVENTSTEATELQQSPFCGFYVAAGVGGRFEKDTEVSGVSSDSAAQFIGGGMTVAALRAAVKSKVGTVATGWSDGDVDKKVAEVNTKLKPDTRIMGTIAVGGGATFGENFYVGGEAWVDLSKKGKLKREGDDVKREGTSGVVPAVGLRLGYVVPSMGTMVYVKPGAAWIKSDLGVGVPSGHVLGKLDGKVRPLVAVGIEKFISRSVSGRVECEYVASCSKKFGDKIKVNYGGGFNVRLMAAYNF